MISKLHWIRFVKGLFVSLRVLLSYRMLHFTGLFLSPEGKTVRLRDLHRRNASLIRRKAIEMKGVMIKVGQFLSSRIDFLPDEYIAELSQLQDQVPPHDFAEIRTQVLKAFGSPPEEVFGRFEERPLAAASLGQVHRAVLRDGDEVAVKIQYPEIGKIIETDIRMFGILIRLLRGRYGRINLGILHEEFSRIIRAELDYIQEGKSAERFRANFRDDDRVIIPAVRWDYTRPTVLTLEFVGGIKITETDALEEAGIDRRDVVNLLAEAYSKMIFIHGFFHGDPHPGNIFVQEGPCLVFVDFGMVQAIPDRISRELRGFANAIVERDTAGIIESLERMGFIIEGADFDALGEVGQSLIDKYRDIKPEELKALTVNDISREIEHVISILPYVQIPNNFILLGRTIGMLNGIAFRLNPEINIIEIGRPYIKEFLRGGEGERRAAIARSLQERVFELWRLPAQLSDFLRKANRGELSFKLAKREIEEISGEVRAITNVLLLVVLAVTTAASALFFFLMEQRTASVIAAGGAALLGLLSVFRLMRR